MTRVHRSYDTEPHPGQAAALDLLHPAVRSWLEGCFGSPSEAQIEAWPAIRAGADVLLAAPTGSGKTLAGFLLVLDDLLKRLEAGEELVGIQAVYISPLRALTHDIHTNLDTPLCGITEASESMGLDLPTITARARTGDTTPAERRKIVTSPPHILVTTPESFYLLLTSKLGSQALRRVRTLIVDEIHALAPGRRGAHLSLSLERLDELVRSENLDRPQRIGLSATQRPMDLVGDFLAGMAKDRPPLRILDLGHRRKLDLGVRIPSGEDLHAISSTEWWDSLLDNIAERIRQHGTTLVFVNTRKMAERVAFRLAARLGEEVVGTHHGSLSPGQRQRAESDLREGRLQALVATASLELGLDVGHIDLVCQIGSPRAISTMLQRVGRSGHGLGRVPKGRLFPTSRDELVESAAAVRAFRQGRLDVLQLPRCPLDVVAQQVVAHVAEETRSESDVLELVRRATVFHELAADAFEKLLDMLATGLETPRGKRGQVLHRDRINGTIRGRRGARMLAITCGGTIADTGEYKVVLDPDETFLGTVHEDFAIEATVGDIFNLGSHAWKIRRVESGKVRVVDAKGAPPTFPFWIAEAPSRTKDLSREVGVLRRTVGDRLDDPKALDTWLGKECLLDGEGARQLREYVAAQKGSTRAIPSDQHVLVERFFDESGGQQLVVHSCAGARINRGLGLVLRKRFCRAFNQELQAAANDDSIVLSLGIPQSFPMSEVGDYLKASNLSATLSQAFLASPLFPTRVRWNMVRALILKRFRSGKRVPFPLMRMEADDLLAAAFPDQASCQEHVTYPIPIPDHPMIQQSMQDCLYEVADIEELQSFLDAIAAGEIQLSGIDTTEPSPFAHEILGARPFTFLDDAPLEERRTRSVAVRRVLPEESADLGVLDAAVMASVREQLVPELRDVDELHEFLLDVLWWPITGDGPCAGMTLSNSLTEEALHSNRAALLTLEGRSLLVARENCARIKSVFPQGNYQSLQPIPEHAELPTGSLAEVLDEAVRGWASLLGPLTGVPLSTQMGVLETEVVAALDRLSHKGILLKGTFDPDPSGEQWCDRRVLARIHRGTLEGLRRSIQPVTAQDAMRFFIRWQHAHPQSNRAGESGLLEVISKLSGWHAPVQAWEQEILATRMMNYRSHHLEHLCSQGEVSWGRMRLGDLRSESGSHRQTPIALCLRSEMDALLTMWGRPEGRVQMREEAERLTQALEKHGALFTSELERAAGLIPAQVEVGLRELVAHGRVACDSFGPLRRLVRRKRVRSGAQPMLGGRGAARGGGRWSRLEPLLEPEEDAYLEVLTRQLLRRWGVLCRDLYLKESLPSGWRPIRRLLQRMEDRGEVRGGRFITGMIGEQFALPAAVEKLRRERSRAKTGEALTISVHDPLNLQGVLLPGARIPASGHGVITLLDGVVVDT